ncbi:hypothetical protein [Constantimarinum furrinae]|uniref:Uncharacterized protein n=1 Tax=Constantimarinum furrinae TaxID=2562285 RepID=A0A7G8PSW2_9FLAO|nr:hypothetical protein [Constantimarinum furrinae]QNJ97428.1 hypothetical protein ALE3EI_0853 [Constantimarinum furrinae]
MKILKISAKKIGMGMVLIALPLLQSCKENTDENKTNGDTTQKSTMVKANEVVKSTDTTATGALNPAHGQPGHRCDLPVGAPLTGTPVINSQQTPVLNSGSTPATGDLKVNPPHGQPGHRCDIKVGDPL